MSIDALGMCDTRDCAPPIGDCCTHLSQTPFQQRERDFCAIMSPVELTRTRKNSDEAKSMRVSCNYEHKLLSLRKKEKHEEKVVKHLSKYGARAKDDVLCIPVIALIICCW
jgi:hypothetical protein